MLKVIKMRGKKGIMKNFIEVLLWIVFFLIAIGFIGIIYFIAERIGG